MFTIELNLQFIRPYDFPSVLKLITKQTNINMDEGEDALSIEEQVNQTIYTTTNRF